MKRVFIYLFGLAGLYLLLMIPLPEKEKTVHRASQIPFIWKQDQLWSSLESSFREAKEMDPAELDSLVITITTEADKLIADMEDTLQSPSDGRYELLENIFFMLSPLIAAQEKPSDWYVNFYNRVRKKIKSDSYLWDMNDQRSRITLYRVLYGMRAAVEEILLQTPDQDFVSTFHVQDEKSATPFVNIMGIEVHSGDLLVSRGGAEVSAFISRGNDYPGNFSHVAMIYVDEENQTPYFVEAHIEKGVAVASLDEYLKDRKLRFMVMRPRHDLTIMKEDPELPHKAARYIFERSKSIHIPYDFEMDFHDTTAMFCSEVGSFAYRMQGLDLWEFESTISSDGIINWLQTFGVENFVTQMPSDLEYDPNLSVVAEWRDKETLFKDHLDNAVMDALISRANSGEKLRYNPGLLPVARIIKAFSLMQNLFGLDGIIPEGMGAVQALKNNDFERRFDKVRAGTEEEVQRFTETEGYIPPYWQIVTMAENSISQ